MEIYLAWADTHGALPDAPLFFTSRSASGAFNILTREAVSEALKSCASQSGLNPIYISSHSLRVGGAMQLASRGIALDFIRQRGRWSQLGFSDIALMYTRMDSLRLKAMSSAMGPGPPVGFLPGRI
jgi:site-specific recombinase XerD